MPKNKQKRQKPKRKSKPKQKQKESINKAENKIVQAVQKTITPQYKEAPKYIDGDYWNALFNPGEYKVRIPGIFPEYTSLFYYETVYPLNLQSSYCTVTVFPWELIGIGGTNTGPGWVSFNWSSGTANQYDVSLPHPMQPYMGSIGNPNARYTSYRIVSTVAEIQYVGKILDSAGQITGALYPGTGNVGQIPNVEDMVQKPFSKTEPINKDIIHKYVYLPIDSMDHVFHKNNDPADEVAFRSPIFIRLTGMPSGMQFTVRVKSLVEYIPLGKFCSWVEPQMSRPDTLSMQTVQHAVLQAPKEVFTGQVPKMRKRHRTDTIPKFIDLVLKKGSKYLSNAPGVTGIIGGLVNHLVDDSNDNSIIPSNIF